MASVRPSAWTAPAAALELQRTLAEAMPEGRRAEVLVGIQQEVLQNSSHMESPDFRSFHPQDLELMVRLYDERVLKGACMKALDGRPLEFRLSRRMTKAGGKTSWKQFRLPFVGISREHFEISLSTHLLFQTFRGEERVVTVTGLLCHNRLEAMQRIVEHELIHLCEKLAWNDSNCRARRFQEITHRLFGHLEYTHGLVTTAEVARTELGVCRGSKVTFLFEGRQLTGIVNRITKRATVLVRDPDGMLYSDGRRYKGYYVPLSGLENIGERSP